VHVIGYNLRIIQEYFQPKLAKKIRICNDNLSFLLGPPLLAMKETEVRKVRALMKVEGKPFTPSV